MIISPFKLLQNFPGISGQEEKGTLWPQPRGRKGLLSVGDIWVSSEVPALLGGFGSSFPNSAFPKKTRICCAPTPECGLELDFQPAGGKALQEVRGWSSSP